jgi:pyruvate/2-oxoglutarate dehydrogenase complex dihydrolipoamide acyltransferase (E2) component
MHVETAKLETSVKALEAGVITEIFVKVGDTVNVPNAF